MQFQKTRQKDLSELQSRNNSRSMLHTPNSPRLSRVKCRNKQPNRSALAKQIFPNSCRPFSSLSPVSAGAPDLMFTFVIRSKKSVLLPCRTGLIFWNHPTFYPLKLSALSRLRFACVTWYWVSKFRLLSPLSAEFVNKWKIRKGIGINEAQLCGKNRV